MSSYQIKSTPYFRRMFNKSKKNGQLQRLRDEYERIQEFNDRTIELKMRQVRLKRLFREIEVINVGGGPSTSSGASSGTTPPIHSTPGTAGANGTDGGGGGGGVHGVGQSASLAGGRITRRRQQHANRLANTTPQQRMHVQRMETLAKARLLGQEISRRNGQMSEAGTGGFLRSELRMTAKMQAATNARRAAVERRERAAKRITYGNDQSRQNMQRLLLLRQRQATTAAAAATAETVARHSLPQANSQVPITQQLPRQDVRPSHLYPEYRQLTPSQMRLLAVTSGGESVDGQLRDQGDSLQTEGVRRTYSEQSFHSEDWLTPSMDDVDSEQERQMCEMRRQLRGRREVENEEEELQRSLRMLHKGTPAVRRSHVSQVSFNSTGMQTTNTTRHTTRTTVTTASNRTTATLVTAATSPVNVKPPCEDQVASCSYSATIASHQPSGTVPPQLDDELQQDSLSNSSRWHQVLPWFSAFPNIPTNYPAAPPPHVPRSCDSSNDDELTPPPSAPQRMYCEPPNDAATQAEEEPFPSTNYQLLLSAIKFTETGPR
ncbi:uncharacterized protein LOC113564539 [Drosophila erecta]|uniref:uncharacterized protein LOC113564539 n=1 Tax=Drosophila erecta TaxID=7220 RepID=UPI00017811C7|nr:uncharacterized protein LOC113564539 [Drosophila erecta]